MNSQTPTARLVKIIRRNEAVRVSNVIKHNGEFTKSPLETLNYLLDILPPGSQQLENLATRSDLVENPFMRPEDTEIRVSNRTWTRTVNPNEPFHFGEPEPNLNQQKFTSVNLNQTWTLKIVLKWTEPNLNP